VRLGFDQLAIISCAVWCKSFFRPPWARWDASATFCSLPRVAQMRLCSILSACAQPLLQYNVAWHPPQ